MTRRFDSTPTSLDGYIADQATVEWSTPGGEVFAFITVSYVCLMETDDPLRDTNRGRRRAPQA